MSVQQKFLLFEITNSDFGGVVAYYVWKVEENYFGEAKWCYGRGGQAYRDLNTIERTFAYGFNVRDNYFTVKSLKSHPIRIVEKDGQFKGILTIDGKEAYIEYVYVVTKKSKNKGGLPGVDHLEIHGFRTDNGEKVQEIFHK